MYKVELPANCPPSSAYEQDLKLYRLFKPDNIEGSFINYVDEHPENEGYKTMCKAYGLSFFDTFAAMKSVQSKPNNTNKVIALVEIKSSYGKLEKNGGNGHYTFWPYDSFKIENISFEIVE